MLLESPPYRLLVELLRRGKLVPFLSAGASLAIAPPESADAREELDGFPSGRELAYRLAARIGLSAEDVDVHDLLEVASCFALYSDRHHLEETLRQVFARQGTPGHLHSFLASTPALRLIVTTNYDTVLESAFREASRPFHLIMTPLERSTRRERYVLWWPPSATTPERARPDRPFLESDGLTIIYKIHGGFDPLGGWHTSVVTEEDYFEIGGRIYETSLLPLEIREHLSRSSLLFLGYSLRDMHVRHLVTASRLWAGSESHHHLVTKTVSKFDRARFKMLHVHLYELSIEAFLKGLESEQSDKSGR